MRNNWKMHKIDSEYFGQRKFERNQVIYYDEDVKLIVNGETLELQKNEKLKLRKGDKIEYFDSIPKVVYSKNKYWFEKNYEQKLKPFLSIIINILVLVVSAFSLKISGDNLVVCSLSLIVVLISIYSILKIFILYLFAKWKFINLSKTNSKVTIKFTNGFDNQKELVGFFKTGFFKSTFLEFDMPNGNEKAITKSKIVNFSFNFKTNSINYKYIQVKGDSEPDNILIIGSAVVFLTSKKGIYYTESTFPNLGEIKIDTK